LDHATRDGATLLHILTNLPRQVSAKRVAQLYRNRWTLETVFQHLEAYFHSEINTLGYPKGKCSGTPSFPSSHQKKGTFQKKLV
jgi:Transposase DDE domain